jgi:uncharacterized membrane protein
MVGFVGEDAVGGVLFSQFSQWHHWGSQRRPLAKHIQ